MTKSNDFQTFIVLNHLNPIWILIVILDTKKFRLNVQKKDHCKKQFQNKKPFPYTVFESCICLIHMRVKSLNLYHFSIGWLLFPPGIPRRILDPIFNLPRNRLFLHLHSVRLNSLMGSMSPQTGSPCHPQQTGKRARQALFQVSADCHQIAQCASIAHQWSGKVLRQ